MRCFLRAFTSVGLSLLLFVPALMAAGCASHQNDHLNEAIGTLASNGVAVYDGYDAKALVQPVGGTASAMHFTRWQLTAMVHQADAGMGIAGTALDQIAQAGKTKGLPPFSYFIAAWMSDGGSPLALYSQRLMGPKPDYKHASKLTYPLLVVALFIADLARVPSGARSASAHDDGWENWIAQPAQADGICDTVNAFFKDTIGAVEHALQVSNPGTLGSVWNKVISLVFDGIGLVIHQILQPLLAPIYAAIGALVLVTQIASSLQPWTISVEENPASVYLGDQPQNGSFIATLNAPSIPWPSDLTSCITAIGGADLTNINAKNAPVQWETFGSQIAFNDVATVTNQSSQIDSSNVATLSYATKPWDTSHKACSKYVNIGSIGAKAIVARQDAQRLEQIFADAVLGQLPTLLKGAMTPYIQSWLASANASLNAMLASKVTGTGTTAVWEYAQDPAQCQTTSQPAQSPGQPSAQPSSESTALVGNWTCVTNASIQHKELGTFNVSVNTSISFTKDTATGLSYEGVSLTGGNSVYNGPGTGAQHSGSGHYTYTPNGSETGHLHVGSRDYDLTWSGDNAWSMDVTSPVPPHRTYHMKCHR